MTAKQYLQQLQRLNIVIEQKIREVTDLRLQSVSLGSFDYSKENVKSTTPNNAAFVNKVELIVQLEREINNEIDKFVKEKHLIINQIQSLKNGKYIDILYKRYVEFKSLEIIAVEMNYTYQYTRELHGYALQNFEKTYKNLL